MRIAVSGSHGVGKSTLIAAFLERRPEYVHQPEAFEVLGDDIDLSESGGPTAEGLRALLAYTAESVTRHAPGACVIHERSPVDYLAYATASRGAWPKGAARRFLEGQAPIARAALRHLDLVVLVPVSSAGPGTRPGEDRRFRKRVDDALRRALIDDDHDLLAAALRVVELPRVPARQLDELLRLASQDPHERLEAW